jgi:hypothetical protein
MYTLINDTLIKGLIELRQKGVKILAIFDDKQIRKYNDTIIRLTNADIDWRTTGSKGSSMHNKFIIIDGVKTITGSFNWTYRASKNKENVVIVEDHRTSLSFLDEFNLIWESISSQHYKEKLGQDCYDKLQTELKLQEQDELHLLEKIKNFDLLEEGYKRQIEGLKKDHKKQKNQIEGLTKQIVDIKIDHSKQIEDIKKQIVDIKIDHSRQIEGLKIDHKKQIEDIKKDYKNQIENIKKDHNSQIENTKGTLILPDGTEYVGEYENGIPHGHGIQVSPDGEKYKGEFWDGMRHGQGTLTYPDGTTYKGEFEDGEPHGHGIQISPDGEEYEGEFYNGFPTGE